MHGLHSVMNAVGEHLSRPVTDFKDLDMPLEREDEDDEASTNLLSIELMYQPERGDSGV